VRRPAVPEGTNDDQIVQLFNQSYRAAVRYAQSVGEFTRADAEDVVADVFLSLWKNRLYLTPPVGHAYLFVAVRNGAMRKHLYAWERHLVAMDPEALVGIERMTYDPTRPAIPVPL
jgi:DNA-directed RNA polymerase specialized sigma24 family protein